MNDAHSGLGTASKQAAACGQDRMDVYLGRDQSECRFAAREVAFVGESGTASGKR